jgi:hypothetical protein
MLSLDLSGAVLAPKILDRINEQKTKSREVAAVMPANYRERILGCCDFVKTRKFGNGYEKIAKLSCCRVRGCPICDFSEWRKTMGKVCARIDLHKKENPLSGVIIVRVESNTVGISELSREFDSLSEKLAKVVRLKNFPKPYWCRVMSIDCDDKKFRAKGRLIILPKPIYFSGKKHISKSEWQALLGDCSVETFRHEKYQKKPVVPKISSILKESFLDLTKVSVELVPEFLQIVHKRHFRTFKRGFIPPILEKEKPQYPSTKAILSDSWTNYSVFAPDVVTMDFENDRYLQVEDFDIRAMLDDVQLQII